MSIFSKQRMGIDLGTAQTIIYLENKGIVLREPTVLARKTDNQEIVAFGKEAQDLLGRTSDKIELVHPIQNGTIHSFSLTKELLAYFIKKMAIRRIGRPEVVIGAPGQISKVERKALVDALRELGVHRAMIVDETFAAALGANLAIYEPRGHMIVDIGAGTTDIASISYGEIIANQTLMVAGQQMNDNIISYIRERTNVLIGQQTAERIKQELGNAYYQNQEIEQTMIISGQGLASGIPTEIEVRESLIASALDEIIHQVVLAMKEVLSHTPPELSADIFAEGIYLCGGGALLNRLPERLQTEIGVPVNLVDNPLDVVAIGAGELVKRIHDYASLAERYQA
ncbi:rod shape-determining protein [Ignavigranum ruoffiae]|uniref:rod shape-determining protein n=1 Tax=Ignavigranum ruoffiae TaxID=89093 RepID=UPI002054A879|nr:rod shape-determining protein [Ignavigranum ruoffiae]UPQ85353.1 rod shape-determining protein [Ignavigranum ruoffiae]